MNSVTVPELSRVVNKDGVYRGRLVITVAVLMVPGQFVIINICLNSYKNASPSTRETMLRAKVYDDDPTRWKEIQVKIYEYYYPQWSLVVRDHSFSVIQGSALFDVPYSQPEGQPTSCQHRCKCPPFKCPEADIAILFGRAETSTYVPSINLVLTCRSVYALAYPAFLSSYNNTIDISLASHCLGNRSCRSLFTTRFQQLLARTNELHLDVSRLNPFIMENGIERFNVVNILPTLNTIVMKDEFRCTNTHSLLEKFGAWNWPVNMSNKQLEGLLREATRKRTDLTEIFLLVATVLHSSDKEYHSEGGKTTYVCHCQVEGVEGTYEVSMPFTDPPKISFRKLHDEEVDKEHWQNVVEEADYQAREPNNCLVM